MMVYYQLEQWKQKRKQQDQHVELNVGHSVEINTNVSIKGNSDRWVHRSKEPGVMQSRAGVRILFANLTRLRCALHKSLTLFCFFCLFLNATR